MLHYSQNFNKIRDYFCKLNDVLTVPEKYPKRNKSNSHTQRHFPTVYYVVFFGLQRYFRNEVFLFNSSAKISIPSSSMHISGIVTSHNFPPIALLFTKLPLTPFHPVLLPLPLFTSKHPPCNIFLSNTLCLTWSLNMLYNPHTHT